MMLGKKTHLVFILLVLSFSGCLSISADHKVYRNGLNDVKISVSGEAFSVSLFTERINQKAFPKTIRDKIIVKNKPEIFEVSCTKCSMREISTFMNYIAIALEDVIQGLSDEKKTTNSGELFWIGQLKPNLDIQKFSDGYYKGSFINNYAKNILVDEIIIQADDKHCIFADFGELNAGETLTFIGFCNITNPSIAKYNLTFRENKRTLNSYGSITFDLKKQIENPKITYTTQKWFRFPYYINRLEIDNGYASNRTYPNELQNLAYTITLPNTVTTTTGLKIAKNTVDFDITSEKNIIIEWADPFYNDWLARLKLIG